MCILCPAEGKEDFLTPPNPNQNKKKGEIWNGALKKIPETLTDFWLFFLPLS